MQGGEHSAPEVEVVLLRAVLETAAHDLGGLSGALAMHADALQLGAEGQGVERLKRISGELRTLGRQLRELRGPVGGATLAPSRAGLVANWMTRTLRFGRVHLPRGTAFEGEVPDTVLSVSDESAHALTLVVFALLREMRDVLDRASRNDVPSGAPTTPRRSVHLTTLPRETDVLVTLELFINNERSPIERSDSEWWTFAQARASREPIALSLREGIVELVASLAND